MHETHVIVQLHGLTKLCVGASCGQTDERAIAPRDKLMTHRPTRCLGSLTLVLRRAAGTMQQGLTRHLPQAVHHRLRARVLGHTQPCLRKADARMGTQLTQPVAAAEGQPLVIWAIGTRGEHAGPRTRCASAAISVQEGGIEHVVHWADKGEGLRALRRGYRTLAQPVPEFVAVAPEGGEHHRAVEHAREGEAMRKALAQLLKVVDMLSAACVIVLGTHPWRGRRYWHLVLKHEVVGAGDHLIVVIREPHAPITKALPLAERVVHLVAKLVGGMHGHRPVGCGRVQLLHKEGVATSDGRDGEDSDARRLGGIGQADAVDAARPLRVLGRAAPNPLLVNAAHTLASAAPLDCELAEFGALTQTHAPAMAAAVAVEQVIERRLVLLVLLAHHQPNLPLCHRRDAVGRRPHSEYACVLVDRVVEASRVLVVVLGRHAIRRHDQVCVRKVLKAGQPAVEHGQWARRPHAIDVREHHVHAKAQHRK
mmetsp:Transcript_1111/g.2393  ORF Transcript_1111/g.2393 Transcript_1111/m.2393 type:complete len:481 (+) Transcript_1111:160-1602(+)